MEKFNAMYKDGSLLLLMCSLILSWIARDTDGFLGGLMIGLSGGGLVASLIIMSKRLKLKK